MGIKFLVVIENYNFNKNMKENFLNNTKEINSKLNLPTTWTKKRIVGLFLTGWLSFNGVEAGKTFENCLSSNINTTVYGSLLNYPSLNNLRNMGDPLRVCCPSSSACYSGNNCTNWGPPTIFACNRINQTIICVGGNTNMCGGVVGDTPINSIYNSGIQKDKRLDTNNTYSYLTNLNSTFGVSYYKKDDSGKIIFLACSTGTPCENYNCAWDNGGWTCFPNFGDILHNSSCYLQFPVPLPGLVSSSTSTLISSSTSSPNLTPPINNSNSELPKIISGVGGGVGVIVIGGVTYYCCCCYRKKQEKQEKESQYDELSNDISNADLSKLENLKTKIDNFNYDNLPNGKNKDALNKILNEQQLDKLDKLIKRLIEEININNESAEGAKSILKEYGDSKLVRVLEKKIQESTQTVDEDVQVGVEEVITETTIRRRNTLTAELQGKLESARGEINFLREQVKTTRTGAVINIEKIVESTIAGGVGAYNHGENSGGTSSHQVQAPPLHKQV